MPVHSSHSATVPGMLHGQWTGLDDAAAIAHMHAQPRVEGQAVVSLVQVM